MEPSANPPWRVLDAPAASGGAGPDQPTATADRAAAAGAPLRILATVGAAILCAIVAVVLAANGGAGSAVVVDGGSGLPAPAASGFASGLPGGGRVGGTGGEIVVEVVGAVPRPGVFRLPAGSRVGDLITAAGGYGLRVDTARAETELNLAATLQDGVRVRVPSRDDPAAAATADPGGADGGTGPAGNPLDLNRATQAELEELPGIGPATAQKILTAREEAPFASVDELRSRGILGEKTFEKVRDLVTVP